MVYTATRRKQRRNLILYENATRRRINRPESSQPRLSIVLGRVFLRTLLTVAGVSLGSSTVPRVRDGGSPLPANLCDCFAKSRQAPVNNSCQALGRQLSWEA